VIVFPAVDIQGGKAVRLRRGDFRDVTVFGDDPLELAKMWEAQGAEALHVVDLDAARTGDLANFPLVERIVQTLSIPVEYGGGIRSAESLEAVAALGVRWAVMGTAAVTARDLLDLGVERLGDRLVRILTQRGVGRIVYTDTSRDGMLGGPNLPGLKELAEVTTLEIVLSGGIAILDDLRRLRRLALPNVCAVIVGRALYEDAFTLADAQAAVRA
jgi:phosphoribosylformimino-5-aminoimidazole carboxamide ribotide isomerase